MKKSVETARRHLGARPTGVRKQWASLALLLAALALTGCVATGDPEPVARHWIRPPATASNLQPMPTAGEYAANSQLVPAAVQWTGNAAPGAFQGIAAPDPVAAPDESRADPGTPPGSWPLPQSIPPAGSADAAMPSAASPPAATVAPVSAPRLAAQPVQPVSVTRIAIAATPAPRLPKAPIVPVARSGALPLPTNIPPPQSTAWVAPKPLPVPTTQTFAPAAAPRPTIIQSAYLPASRVVMPTNPPAAVQPSPVWQAAAPSSGGAQTSYQAAVAQAAALPARRQVSGVWQQGSVAIVNYSTFGAFATQTPRPVMVPTGQPTDYVQQQFGPVAVDYSVLQ
jgi:hypothetical protein